MKNGTLAVRSLPLSVVREGDALRYGRWLAIAVALALLPRVPGLNSDFGHSLLSQMGIAAVFALSYNMLLGQTGLLSFGHAVYFGLGGYAAIHLMRAINHGLPIPMPFVPLAGAATGLLFGIVFGAVSTRRAGTIFALISLGIGELVYASTFMLPGLFGGEEGITANRTRAPALFGLKLGSQLEVYYVIAVWALVAAMLMHAFTRTPLGRMCNAVATTPSVPSSSATTRSTCAFSPLRSPAVRGAGRRTARDQLRDRRGRRHRRAALRDRPADGLHGRRHAFRGPRRGSRRLDLAPDELERVHRRLAPIHRALLHGDHPVRPSGLIGLIAMHRPIVRTRAFGSVLAAYFVALGPALVMGAGAVLLIEMCFRVSTEAERGTAMRVLGVAFDTATPWPWVAAAALLAVGFVAFRATWPRVGSAWSRAMDEALSRRGPGNRGALR
jgi:branched-chain amino acid transport system permease protein